MKSSAHFDPWRLRLDRGRSVYEEFHEWAHVEQCVRQTWLWRSWARLWRWPVLGRVCQAAVEIEAALMARRDLRACGIWRREDARQAVAGIAAYLRALTIL